MRILQAFIFVAGLVFVGVAGWQIGGRLSSDAIAMAVGVLFGGMAIVPAMLLVLAIKREPQGPPHTERRRYREIEQQPPIILVRDNHQARMIEGEVRR